MQQLLSEKSTQDACAPRRACRGETALLPTVGPRTEFRWSKSAYYLPRPRRNPACHRLSRSSLFHLGPTLKSCVSYRVSSLSVPANDSDRFLTSCGVKRSGPGIDDENSAKGRGCFLNDAIRASSSCWSI